MTANILVGFFSVLLSVCTAYIPGFRTWYAKLNSIHKKLLMLGGLLVICIVMFVLSCFGYLHYFIIDLKVSCNTEGVIFFLKLLGTAVVANQATFSITPKLESVKKVWNGD